MDTDHIHSMDGTKLAAAAAAAAIIIGSVVLVGWALDIAVLKSIQPGWVSMKANTAVCFILIGIALWLTTRQSLHSTQYSALSTLFARLCGLLAGLIGLLSLGEYVFGLDIGIDQLLFHEPPGTVGTSYPGRMAPETALDFVLLSMALWIINVSHQTRKTIFALVSLGLLVATFALAALLSYATPGLGAHGWLGLTTMAVHTSILFTMLGMAVIAISWQPEVLSWSLGRRATAAIACGMTLLVLIGISTSRSQFWMKETNRRIAHTEKVQGEIGNILVEVIDAQARIRGYVITGDELFLKRYLATKANSDTRLDELRRAELVATELAHQQHFSEIEAKVKAHFQWFQQVIDTRRTGMTEVARNNMVRHGEELLNILRSTFDRIESEHRQLVQQLKQGAENVSRFIYLTIFIGTFASLLIYLSVIFRLNSVVNEREQKERALQESEEKFRAIFKEAKDGIVLTDAETGLMADCNAELERQCGRPLAQLKTLHPWDLRPPELQEAAHRKFEEIKTAGHGSAGLGFQRPDGTYIPVEVIATCVHIGNRDYVISVSRDITERTQIEAKLLESEELYRLMQLNSMDAIMLTAPDGSILSANPAACNMLQRTEEEICRLGRSGVVDMNDPRLPVLLGERERTGSARGELTMVRKDGSRFEVELSTSVFLDSSGKKKTSMIIRDITERKLIQENLRHSEEKFSNTFHVGPAGMTITRISDGKFIEANEAFLNMFERSREETIGHTSIELNMLSPEERANLVRRQIESGGLHNAELLARAKSGRMLNLLFSSRPMRVDGEDCYLTTLIDITEHKKMESKMAEQFNELRRWREATIGREMRTLELKHEVNKLLQQSGQPPRYPSAEEPDAE